MPNRFRTTGAPRDESPNAPASWPTDDFDALARVTADRLPALDDTARQAARRRASRQTEGLVSRTLEIFRARPWAAPVAAGLLAAAGLFLPISYQKTTGYDVRMTLSQEVPAALQASLLSGATEALGAANVDLSNTGNGQALLVARVPAGSAAGLQPRAEAFARVLTRQGLPAVATVEPVREVVSGTLYAMTRDRVVRIDIAAEGRSEAEIEADVRAQLEASGITGAEVMVNQDGDQTTIQIYSESGSGQASGNEPGTSTFVMPQSDGSASTWTSDGSTAAHPDFEFTIDGKQPDGGKTARIEMKPGDAPRTDAEIEAEIERQLREQGKDVDAVVQNGRVIRITPIKN